MREFILNKVLSTLQLRAPLTAIRSLKILEFDYGHFRSARKWQAVDRQGPIPWLTYPAVDYLNMLDLSKSRIFEFGSGNSTLYWEKRAKKVISVERNPKWYNTISTQLSSAKLILQEDLKKYPREILKYGYFDIILVDGAVRHKCVVNSVKQLKKGLIILDNSQDYPKTKEYLHNQGFTEVTFVGFGPIVNYVFHTSFFMKDFNPKFI